MFESIPGLDEWLTTPPEESECEHQLCNVCEKCHTHGCPNFSSLNDGCIRELQPMEITIYWVDEITDENFAKTFIEYGADKQLPGEQENSTWYGFPNRSSEQLVRDFIALHIRNGLINGAIIQ